MPQPPWLVYLIRCSSWHAVLLDPFAKCSKHAQFSTVKQQVQSEVKQLLGDQAGVVARVDPDSAELSASMLQTLCDDLRQWQSCISEHHDENAAVSVRFWLDWLEGAAVTIYIYIYIY